MNTQFTFKGFELNLPNENVHVKVEELTYRLEDANVLEIAKASTQIAKSFLEIAKEIEELSNPKEDYSKEDYSNIPFDTESSTEDEFVWQYHGFDVNQRVLLQSSLGEPVQATILKFEPATRSVYLYVDSRFGGYNKTVAIDKIMPFTALTPEEQKMVTDYDAVKDDNINDEELQTTKG